MKAFIVPMLAAALLAPAAHAQHPPIAGPVQPGQHDKASLSLVNAIGLARQNNNELRILEHEVAALEARVQQAGARPNPTIEYLQEGKRDQAGASTLQLAVPLELGGKRGARVDAAKAELQIAVADLGVARMRVQADVVGAFHEAYLAGLRLGLATSTSASARQSTQSAASRVMAGKISPVEETRAKVAEANLEVETVQARRDFADARIKLALLCGTDLEGLPKLAAPDLVLPVSPSALAIAERLAAAPLAQRANADLTWRNAAARLERSKRYPDVSLIVGQKREGIGRDKQTVLGLSVPLPLFDRNRGAILEAQRRVDKSRAELAAGRMRLRADAALAASRLGAALEQEQLIREHVLPAGESGFVAASRGFDAGKFSFLEVLDAQRSYFHAQAQHLRAVSEAHRAAADLAALTGPDTGPSSTINLQDTQ